MPRDGSGTYTLPGGVNPVVSGTTIDAAWANPTLTDVATALTDSLSRTGSGGMLVPFLNADGAINAPGIAWVNEPSMGIYRPSSGEMRAVIGGVDRTRWVDALNPLQIWIVSDASWRPVLNTFNDFILLGALVTDDSTLTRAGFNIPLGVEPTVPVEGDFWKTATDMLVYVNGAAQSILGATNVPPSSGADVVLRGDGSGGWAIPSNLIITSTGSILTGASFQLFNVGLTDGIIMSVTGTTAQWVSAGSLSHLEISFQTRFRGIFKIEERAAPGILDVGYGQIWVANDIATTLRYDDDLGTSMRIMASQTFNNDGDPRTVNNSSVLVTIPQLSGIILDVGIYLIEIQMRVNQASAVPDLRLALTPQGGGAFAEEDFRTTSISQLTNAFTFQDEQASTVLDAVQDQTGNHLYQSIGYVRVSVADTWDLQFAQVTPTVANTIIDDPSWVRVTRIG